MNTWKKSCVSRTFPGGQVIDDWWEAERAGRKYRCDTEAEADFLIAAMQVAEQPAPESGNRYAASEIDACNSQYGFKSPLPDGTGGFGRSCGKSDWIDAAMDQAEVFAEAWSTANSLRSSTSDSDLADAEKKKLRAMIVKGQP
jgi:hypothetical protein